MDAISLNTLVWSGIFVCLTQSAMFSGLNLALLGISRMRLEVYAATGNDDAQKILAIRKDFHFLLTTILWGNVTINVLLTLLSNSVMAGISAFLFSTFFITLLGEILPQAYFSRHAMRMGALLAPILKLYQFILFPVAKPSAMILDWWLGAEGIRYFKEADLRTMLHKHIDAEHTDVSRMEGIGALNFLALDDIAVSQLGQVLDPTSTISLPFNGDSPKFPELTQSPNDPFVIEVNRSGKKWVVIIDTEGRPRLVMNANAFLRNTFCTTSRLCPLDFCHQPVIVNDSKTLLGEAIPRLGVQGDSGVNDLVDDDVILVWTNTKRVITGGDILGRLLQGIARRQQLIT